ncbi:taurine catabolism dioxygenase TauD [Coprinopsis cinerea AmutBmut pab1-1]|nr:taurine catabolism dioxygenase TauD [Coprinopsis cinerea AmutBmut pab1-1]
MFETLPPEWPSFAARAKATYAPRPFEWIWNAKTLSTGLGLVTEGKEVGLEDLSDWEEAKVKVYPFLWKNPVTAKLHLQVHPMAVREIIVEAIPYDQRSERDVYPDGGHITDLNEIREVLYKMQRPGIAPKVS